MGELLLWTVGFPVICCCIVIASSHRVRIPKGVFMALGLVFLGIGGALGLGSAAVRPAAVPGDYVGWSSFEIFSDLFSVASLLGGGFVICGFVLILGRKHWAR